MALGSTQSLTEMSTRSISWGQRRPVRKADNRAAFYVPTVLKCGSLKLLEPSGSVQVYTGVALPFTALFDLLRFSHRLKINFSGSFEVRVMKGVQDCMRTYHPKGRKCCAMNRACLMGVLSKTLEFIITLSSISRRRKQTRPQVPENWLSVTAGCV